MQYRIWLPAETDYSQIGPEARICGIGGKKGI
jgi:hypothetical protein